MIGIEERLLNLRNRVEALEQEVGQLKAAPCMVGAITSRAEMVRLLERYKLGELNTEGLMAHLDLWAERHAAAQSEYWRKYHERKTI